MADVQIQVPGSLTEAAVLRFSSDLQSLPEGQRYIIDLSRLGHVEPFGMLVCASVLRRFVARRKQAGAQFAAVGFSNNSYAAHMGLYEAFGLPHGKKPGEASGSSRYIPLTCLKIQDFRKAAGYGPVGEAIASEAKRLARVLLQRTDGSQLSHISYAFLEIMRNVVEHSYADEIWCVGQCWPNKKAVEIAILDEGIGVKASLSRNPDHRRESDEEALHLALEAGISGAPPKTDEMKFRDAYADEWANAGLGLFVVSQLCAEGGQFSIVSGKSCLCIRRSGTTTYPTDFAGTAVRMRLDSVADSDINAFIERVLPATQARGRSALWTSPEDV
jgi:hypothetical protein